MLQSVVVLLAAGGLLASGAEPVGALDSAAYDRLLKTHVRPGTVNGFRLNLVDYAAVKADRVYAQGVADFAEAKPELLGTEAERFAFWANAYNLLAIKAVIDQYPVKSIKDGGTLFQSIWKKKVGTVAGQAYALDDIEHGILRREFREPRVHFAIVCASLSCPDIRSEPFQGARLNAQLADAAATFLANPTKGLDWSATPEGELLSGEARQILEEGLALLPEHYRAILVLRDVEELSNEEVAEVLGESVASVKSRLHRARMALREVLTRRLAGRTDT